MKRHLTLEYRIRKLEKAILEDMDSDLDKMPDDILKRMPNDNLDAELDKKAKDIVDKEPGYFYKDDPFGDHVKTYDTIEDWLDDKTMEIQLNPARPHRGDVVRDLNIAIKQLTHVIDGISYVRRLKNYIKEISDMNVLKAQQKLVSALRKRIKEVEKHNSDNKNAKDIVGTHYRTVSNWIDSMVFNNEVEAEDRVTGLKYAITHLKGMLDDQTSARLKEGGLDFGLHRAAEIKNNIEELHNTNVLIANQKMVSALRKKIKELESELKAIKNRKQLESLTYEGKQDQEILNDFLGDDYYNKYQTIKNRISDPEYKDIYKLIKKDPNEVKDYIDNFQSNTDIRRSDKKGATKLYEDDEWIVYRITTYPAAQLYGKNTRWCITGRYEGHEERGEEYFYNYIKNNKLDGGYYFYINKKDPYTKYCILQKENGRIHSIWDAGDTNMGKSSVDLPTDLPEVEGVNLKRAKTKKDLLIRAINHDDGDTIKELVNKGLSPNTVIKKNSALAFAIEKDKVHAVKALLECGADADETSAGGWTLIDNACRKADRKVANDIVRLLIRHSNSISDETFNSVCKFCNYITVKTLLDCGYTPNNESIDSATRFISTETARTVELLLNAGANPNERDKFGGTILSRLMVWTTKEAQAVIKVLRDHGAVE